MSLSPPLGWSIRSLNSLSDRSTRSSTVGAGVGALVGDGRVASASATASARTSASASKPGSAGWVAFESTGSVDESRRSPDDFSSSISICSSPRLFITYILRDLWICVCIEMNLSSILN